MRLFIAEKPQYAKIIAQALGNGRSQKGYIDCGDDKVTWCIGHLLQLVTPSEINPDYAQWRKEHLPMQLRPARLKPIERTAEQFEIVAGLIRQADEIVHAGDPDEEGQLLVDEVLEYCNNASPVKRLMLKDPNLEAAKKALANLVDNKSFHGLYLKALARSVADYVYGLNMTRAYTIAARERGYDGVISIGRVQTAVLALIVNRTLLNKSHVASFYYDVYADIKIKDNIIKAKFLVPDDADFPVDSKKRISEKEAANKIAQACNGNVVSVIRAEIQEKSRDVPLPFSLAQLQARMSTLYGIKAEKTLQLTQDLRDKYSAISYNRSDCNYLTEEQFNAAPALLEKLTTQIEEFAQIRKAGALDFNLKSAAFNESEVSAHTGIIPIAVPDREKMTQDEWRVYNAIAMQFLAQFMPPKRYNAVQVDFQCDNRIFAARAVQSIDDGWTRWLSATDDKGAESETDDSVYSALASLSVGDTGMCDSATVKDEKTKPPALYTEATLLNDLMNVAKYVQDPKLKQLLINRDEGKAKGERGGIGTSATRGKILETLEERGFFVFDKKKILPTQLGYSLIQLLPYELKVPDMTALWHEQQIMIEQGEMDVDEFLNGIESFVGDQINKVDVSKLHIETYECECGGVYKKRKSDNGVFWACSNYPECNNTLPDKHGQPDLTTLSACCPKCSAKMRVSTKTFQCTSDDCDFHVFREIAGKKISAIQIDKLLTKGKSDVLKGFKGKEGKKFEAALTIDNETWKVNFSFDKPSPKAAKAKKILSKRF
ncbi:TPA: DNA topoisomerase [Escherichia coli]